MSKPSINKAIPVALVAMAAAGFYLLQHKEIGFFVDPKVKPLYSSSPAEAQPVEPGLLKKPVPPQDILREELQGTSLAGTDIDRSMLQVVDGRLVLNGGLLLYFDYFLTLEGELLPEAIKQLVWRDLQANYSEVVARQIFDLFGRYLDYLAEVAVRESSVTHEQVIAENLSASDMQNEVRHNHFTDEEIAALFAGYEKMLAKPSQASQQQKIYEEYREAIKTNPAQQESIATELFGPVAAQNLRNVEYRRQQWSGRVAHYEAEKQLLMKSYANDEAGQQQALGLLQQRLFSETEIRRVSALERIHREKTLP